MLSAIEQVNKQSGSSAAEGKRNRFALACKIFVFQLVAILLVEFCLSLAGLGEEEIYKLDPVLGVKHMSNKKVTWRSEGLASSYFNEDGLRETGIRREKAPGVYRIALLGDSLTESLQVPIEKSFGYQMGELLKKKTDRPVEVINFGVSGYSTAQEYLQLKKQVLAYKPDLVLLCYNSRDCFENWSPADEVLTNVRPVAVQLPGKDLAVDSFPVQQWMRTPRARFLRQFEWLREHSRLWGLFAAAEIDWSMHNETYKQLVFFLTKPGKALRKFCNDGKIALQAAFVSKPKSSGLGEASSADKGNQTGTAAAAAAPKQAEPAVSAAKAAPKAAAQTVARNKITQASEQDKLTQASVQKLLRQASERRHPRLLHQPTDPNYQMFIDITLASLLREMDRACTAGGAKFAVVGLPVRSALSVKEGMTTSFNGIDYNDELIMLDSICKDKAIPFINIHQSAKSLNEQNRDDLFFLVHLKPHGHDYVAGQLAPEVVPLMSGRAGDKP